MSEVRDPLSVADEALAANIMTGSLDESTLSLTTRNGEEILGIFSHSFLTQEQIQRLIDAIRQLPLGGVANQYPVIGADGQTVEWITPPVIPERVQLGSNLLDTPIAASTTGVFNLNDELRLDNTFYFFKFGNEFHIVPASSDPLDAGGGSFVLTERSITITNGFTKPLNGIFFFVGAGLQGVRGERGLTGQGVPVGGGANQVLTKIDGTDFNTEWRDNISDAHIKSLADERIAAHEADNTHPDDGLNQSQVDSRVVAGTKEFARTGGRTIQGSDTNFNNRINPNPSGNAGKIPIVNPNGNGYVLGDAPSGGADVKPYAATGGRAIIASDTDFANRLPTFEEVSTPISIDMISINGNRNGTSKNITVINSTLYVLDSNSNTEIFAYNKLTGSGETDKNITGLIGDDNESIWANETTMYVLKHDERIIYAYNLTTKAADPSKNINITNGHRNEGLASDGTTLWVGIDTGRRRLEAYNLSTRQKDSSKDITITGVIRDIWTDGITMYVLQDSLIIAYNISTKARDSSKDWDLSQLTDKGSISQSPSSITSDGSVMYMLIGDYINTYNLSNQQPFSVITNEVVTGNLFSKDLLAINGGRITTQSSTSNISLRTIPNLLNNRALIIEFDGQYSFLIIPPYRDSYRFLRTQSVNVSIALSSNSIRFIHGTSSLITLSRVIAIN